MLNNFEKKNEKNKNYFNNDKNNIKIYITNNDKELFFINDIQNIVRKINIQNNEFEPYFINSFIKI